MTDSKEKPRPDHASVPEPDVRAALARILKSAEFVRLKRVGLFLQFVVDEALAGRGDRLKAFSIAREVYGRDESFDPSSDTIVRVEAGRLRRRLTAYYETQGRDDPVRIELPKGGYTPTFALIGHAVSDAQTETPAPVPSMADALERSRKILISFLVLAIFSILAGWVLFEWEEQAEPSASDVIAEDQSGASKAFLAVLPFATLSDDPVENRFATGLLEAVVTDLAKLSGLSVMAHASLLNLDSRSMDLSTIREEFGATHALRGSLERDDDLIRVNVQLVDIATNSTIWADRLDGDIEDLLALQDVLAEKIVNNLSVNVSPDEQALLKRHHSGNPEALAVYRQALILIMPPNNMDRILAARHMFQRVVDVDPEFAGGYAGMSFSHSATVLFFNAMEPDAELDKGIRFALKAIEIDPEFGMGYATLAFSYAMSGRKGEALFSARRAVAVQPGDAFTLFVYGLSHALAGNSTEAVTALMDAIRLDPAEFRTPYRNVLGLAYFMAHDYSAASELFETNLTIGGSIGPHMDTFRAAAFTELGKEEEARSVIRDLVQSYPGFPVERWLARWHENSDELSRIMDNLYRHGLQRR